MKCYSTGMALFYQTKWDLRANSHSVVLALRDSLNILLKYVCLAAEIGLY
jgi:hypothetical protein